MRRKNRLKILQRDSIGFPLELDVVVPGSRRIQVPPEWIVGSVVRMRIVGIKKNPIKQPKKITIDRPDDDIIIL